MLIVNADDLGLASIATDTALECFRRNRITSTSAMVFMPDSERAATLAREHGIDVGLHINYSAPFTAPNAPSSVRDSHAVICRSLRANKYALLIYRPWLRDAFRRVFDAQYSEFVRLYGCAPSHFDGHQHMHLATNVLLQNLLPAGTRVRRSFSFFRGEKTFANRWYRAAVDYRLKRRHRTTDYFFSLANHLSAERMQRITQLAADSNVELMVHPARGQEFEFLMSDEFERSIARVNCRGFNALN